MITIPGQVFWTYFCGIALMGAGLAIITGIGLRQVALLLGVMLQSRWRVVQRISSPGL